MFLIKTAFWIGLLVLLLPTDEGQQARLYTTAAQTVERAATFCERNPNTCKAGAELWATFLKKAEFAGRMAIGLINDRKAVGGEVKPALNTQPAERGTLTPADLSPTWRGQQTRTAQRAG
jgi:hypothetical protein